MSTNEYDHKPVMLDEVLKGLDIHPEGVYVDCTFGRGGHSKAILNRLGGRGRLFVFDKDPQAIAYAKKLFSGDTRVVVIQGAFSLLTKSLQRYEMQTKVDGLLFDLGVSSPQLDDSNYGFSFLRDGELDMRMDPGTGQSASEWINEASQDDIARVLRNYGEERYSRRIASGIVNARSERAIRRTGQLAEIIASVVPRRERKKDPATRSFMAIRIFINNEIGEIEKVLRQVYDVLKPGGRMLVISFHSLEDRIVKRFLRDEARGDAFPPDLPVTMDELSPRFKIIGKAIKPSSEEIEINPRARSAVLRIGQKLAA